MRFRRTKQMETNKQKRRLDGFDIGVIAVCAIILIVMLYPMYFTVIASVSDPLETVAGNVILYPKGFTLEAYANVFKNDEVWTGYANTILYTVGGTVFNLILTIPAAYALSKKKLPMRRFLTWVFMFTMYFSGGMIPTYLVVKKLGLIDTRWVMMIMGGISVSNLIVTRSFYKNSIPEDLYEAAEVDGCSEIRVFFSIALPLSGSIIAVMTLYYGVGHWNDYFHGLIYLTRSKFYSLQQILRSILLQNQNMQMDVMGTDEEMAAAVQRVLMAESMKYALIFISCAPAMIAYVFVQKKFVKGLMLGAVKG